MWCEAASLSRTDCSGARGTGCLANILLVSEKPRSGEKQAWRNDQGGHVLNEPLSFEGVGEGASSAATAAPTLQAGFHLTALHWPPTGSPTLPRVRAGATFVSLTC